jgi:hypothetical protein
MKELTEYQKNLWAAISGSGVKASELVVFAGRQTGKSMISRYHQQWLDIMGEPKPAFSKVDHSLVDGEPWYTIKCHPTVSKWIRNLPKNNRWHETIDTNWYAFADTFDVCEQVYVELGLKFN